MTFGGEARGATQARGETLILEGCTIATVVGGGTEYRDGHIVIENDVIASVGEGPADGYPGARIDARGCLADVALWRVDDLAGAGIENPVPALVLGPPRDVEMLLVGGRAGVEGGELRTADEPQIAIDIERPSRRLAERAVPSR